MAKCYSCEYRGSVPGDAHSCCRHPEVGDPTMAFFGGKSLVLLLDKLEIQINEHGFNQGWAYWPMNFDPVWIDNCNGYKETE